MTAPEFTRQPGRIIGLFPELLGVGGIQEAGRLTAAALSDIAARRGWSTDFLSLNDPPGQHSLDYAGQTIRLRGFGRAKFSFIRRSIRSARSPEKSIPTVILAAHPYLAVIARFMKRFSPRAKTIAFTHGVEVWNPLPRLRRRALQQADLVLAPSGDTLRKLIDVQGLTPGRTLRLPWPLSPGFLQIAGNAARLPVPPNFPAKRPVILTVGRWSSSERYKGADDLIRAMPRLRETVPDVQLVAVGGGDDLPRLQGIAGDLGVAGGVHFLQNLSREEVAACYAHADVFALPSSGEGFGLVFLEAMAFSKAVVGAAAGGATDLIEDGVNGLLVPPHDRDSLAAALARLLHDEALRVEMGRRGAAIVRERYRFDSFEAQLEEIFVQHLTGE